MLIGTSLLNNKITDYTYGNDFYDYFNYGFKNYFLLLFTS